MVTYPNPKWLQERYEKLGTLTAVAKEAGVSITQIGRLMKKHSLPFRHSSWKSGITRNAAGYLLIFVGKGEPGTTKGGYAYEHRHRMEELLNRRLKKGEVVHHRNGKRDDNRMENLELMLTGQHTALHHTGVVFSEERCRNISKAKLGKPNLKLRGRPSPIRGIVRSDEFKKKVAEGVKRYCQDNPGCRRLAQFRNRV